MKRPRASLLILLISGLLLSLGIFFRSFLLVNFVRPVAFLLWMFWRIVQSVDQMVYWGALLLGIVIYFLLRILPKSGLPTRFQQDRSAPALETVNYWRNSIYATRDEMEGPNILKQDMTRLLTSIYTLKQTDASNFEIYNWLRENRDQIPEQIHAFLFPGETQAVKRRLFLPVFQIFQKWIDRWTGRDMLQYQRQIEAVVAWMEKMMEIQNDS